MKTIYTLTIICIIFVLVSCNNQKDNTYQIIETYRITSSKGSTSSLSVELPISYGYQTIGDIRIENVDSYSYEQKDGYQTLLVDIKGEGTEKIITITYEVTLLNGVNNWNGDTSDEYLMPSEYIDSDNQSIVDVVKDLLIEGDDYKTAQNISKYVSQKIKFDNSTKINQKTLLASEVLANKEGVCGDYANVMTALLRASGIPARSISGLVFNDLKTSSDWTSPAGSHSWVEFYVNGKWYFDDPTWGNRYFANTDGYHLSYGTQPVSLDSNVFQEMIKEIENKKFKVIGAMTAPIKFVAWSDDLNATIIPKVDIIKQ